MFISVNLKNKNSYSIKSNMSNFIKSHFQLLCISYMVLKNSILRVIELGSHFLNIISTVVQL